MAEPNNPLGSHSPEFLRAILESIQDGVYFVDHDRRITYWNAGAEAISGYLRQDVVGRLCTDNLLRHCTPAGEELCATACPLQETLGDGRPREAFLLLRHKDGHRLPVRVRATAVRDAQGRILGAAEVFEEQAFDGARERQRRTLESLRLLDSLTGLANREMIAARLDERTKELARCGVPFGVLLIDIDRLLEINRNWGRDAGDSILRMAAHTLAKGVDPQTLLGRWEEDQFLVILDNCDLEMLAAAARRLRAMIEISSIQWWGEPVRVTVSIAGSLARPGEEEAAVLARATSLLRLLQGAGGSGCRVG